MLPIENPVSAVDDPSESTNHESRSASVRERLDATVGPELAGMLVSALSSDLLRRGPRDVDTAGEQPPPAS
jgi:hypothetical protein